MADLTVDNLIDYLRSEGSGQQEKVAFSKSDAADTASVQMLNKVASELNSEETLKQAAAAKVSGQIMSDMIMEKFASSMGPMIAQAVHEKLAALLPEVVALVVAPAVQMTLEKIAVGTSSVIPLGGKSEVNDGSATEVQMNEDKVGRTGSKDQAAPYFHTDKTEGASVSGGSSPEGGAGTKPEGWPQVHKLAAANAEVQKFMIAAEKEKNAFLSKVEADPNTTHEMYKQAVDTAAAYMRDAEQKAVNFYKAAELEADLARYQELEAKAQSGALTPQEAQELDMLKQKLMAAAQQAQQGAPAGGPPGAGGPPPDAGGPGAGGPPPGGAPGSQGDECKEAAIRNMIAQHLKK